MTRKIKGYEGKILTAYTEKEVLKIVETGTHKEILDLAVDMQNYIHYADDSTKKTKFYPIALESRNKLEVLVANELRAKGFKLQTQEDYQNGIDHKDTDLHMTFDLCMSEHPTRENNNFSVVDLICNDKGEFITKEELEKKLYADPEIESICQDEFDQLAEEDKKLVNEFMESEGFTLADIHEIEEDDSFGLDQIRIEVGSQEYYIIRNSDEIDEKMMDYLEQDSEYEYFYTEGIKAERINPIQTTYKDFLEEVLNDGFENIVGTYDGSSTALSGKAVYYRRN